MFDKRWLVASIPAALLVACSSGSSPSATSVVGSAVTATIAAGTVQEKVTAVSPTASGSSTASATGSYAFAGDQGTFVVDTGALLGKVDVLVSGGSLYLHLPAAIAAVAAHGKPWATITFAKAPTLPGVGNTATLAACADLSRAFDGLQNGLTAATKVGSETIDGVSTTHYTATVDLTKDTSPLAAVDRALLGGSSEHDDVYIGAGNRIVRIVTRVAVSGGAQAVVTDDLANYGTPVTVTLPKAGDTIDASTIAA